MARVKLTLPAKFLFKTEIPVLIGDINYGHHLANDAVLRLCHEARIQFLQSMDYTEFDIESCGLIMADAEIRFVSQAFHGEMLTCLISVDAETMTSSGFEIITWIRHQNNKDIAHIKNGMVFFDYESQQVCNVPAGFLAKLKAKEML